MNTIVSSETDLAAVHGQTGAPGIVPSPSAANSELEKSLELPWFVAHTRPRCEKKFQQFCEREGFPTALPCYRAAHNYRGKTAVFQKPLFPGYVFLKLAAEQRGKAHQSDHLANLLVVSDQELFLKQLADVLTALNTDCEIRLSPAIGEGMRVKIKNGPLRGMDGWVEHRQGMNVVLLRLDFIGQAAAVTMAPGDLELI